MTYKSLSSLTVESELAIRREKIGLLDIHSFEPVDLSKIPNISAIEAYRYMEIAQNMHKKCYQLSRQPNSIRGYIYYE